VSVSVLHAIVISQQAIGNTESSPTLKLSDPVCREIRET